MGYKFKPNKSVAKRFSVTKTGKLKCSGGKRSHLMSRRDAKTRRQQRQLFTLHEGHAINMRRMMGLSKLKPAKVAHQRRLAEQVEDITAEVAAK